MLKNLIVLPGGRELSAGEPGAAIRQLRLLQTVTGTQELEPGAVCAGMLELSVMDAEDLTVTAGEELTLYKVDEDGTRFPVGVFTAEKPVRTGAGCFTVTAYDHVARLDKDLTGWLGALTGWPYSLWELARMVCQACGVTLKEDQLPGGGFPVGAFQPGQVTGRQLMRWIAQALGRFCRADPAGDLEFGWYAPVAGLSIGPEELTAMDAYLDGDALVLVTEHITATQEEAGLTLAGQGLTAALKDGTLTLYQGGADQVYYRRGSLDLADYTVAPVERVRIRATAEDIGTVWPQDEGRKNTYIITGNPLLQAMDAGDLVPIAQNLYALMSQVSYVPCTVEIPARLDAVPGSVIPLLTYQGQRLSVYVMTREQTGQVDRLSATGSVLRDSTTAVNSMERKLSGKVLELKMDVEGLRAENRQGQEKAASLEMTVEGITAQVRRQQTQADGLAQQLTAVQQTAQDLSVQVQTIRDTGVGAVTTSTGYTFGADGLRIRKTGEQMENLLDHTGMYVRRSDQVILQANGDGVQATDVAVRNYLVIGSHARLEDYAATDDPNRTACFYIT